MSKLVQIGDRIKTRHGMVIVGGYHLLQRKGRNREIATIVTGNPRALDVECVVGFIEDGTGWVRMSVGEASARIVKEKAMSPFDATMKLRDVKRKLAENKADRKGNRVQTWLDSGLSRAEIGDAIRVEFKNSIEDATYQGMVPSSGNIRFEWRGRRMTTPPQYVKLVEKKK